MLTVMRQAQAKPEASKQSWVPSPTRECVNVLGGHLPANLEFCPTPMVAMPEMGVGNNVDDGAGAAWLACQSITETTNGCLSVADGRSTADDRVDD